MGTLSTHPQGASAGITAGVFAFLEDSKMKQSLQGRHSRQAHARALKCEADANLIDAQLHANKVTAFLPLHTQDTQCVLNYSAA